MDGLIGISWDVWTNHAVDISQSYGQRVVLGSCTGRRRKRLSVPAGRPDGVRARKTMWLRLFPAPEHTPDHFAGTSPSSGERVVLRGCLGRLHGHGLSQARRPNSTPARTPARLGGHLKATDSLFPSDWACQRRAESLRRALRRAPRAARCAKFSNLVGLVLSWRTAFALLVLRARSTCGCCTRAHQGSAVIMLSPTRLGLDPSGPRPAALSTVAHYEKTYRAPQRTNLLVSESNVLVGNL